MHDGKELGDPTKIVGAFNLVKNGKVWRWKNGYKIKYSRTRLPFQQQMEGITRRFGRVPREVLIP